MCRILFASVGNLSCRQYYCIAGNCLVFTTSKEFLCYVSFSYKDLGVTQSLHGNGNKVWNQNYEGQVSDVCQALQVELAEILIDDLVPL